jgi:hypothetical protein
MSSPELTLGYPHDAEAHVKELAKALSPWWVSNLTHTYSGFSGPWIEDVWVQTFDRAAHSECLSDFFGPFVPLLVPWTGVWLRSGRIYPSPLIDALKRTLRPNVPYITVIQNDEGLRGGYVDGLSNVLALSAAGYGHVPIPLFQQPEPCIKKRPAASRPWTVSYFGSMTHAPGGFRRLMQLAVKRSGVRSTGFRKVRGWRSEMARSRFSLVPRGFGRTAFHLMETLQMGLVPIYVYSDTPWLPYGNIINDVVYASSIVNVTHFMRWIDAVDNATVDNLERKIVSMRHSHFEPTAVMRHIAQFMSGGTHDLVCQALPASVRDERFRIS